MSHSFCTTTVQRQDKNQNSHFYLLRLGRIDLTNNSNWLKMTQLNTLTWSKKTQLVATQLVSKKLDELPSNIINIALEHRHCRTTRGKQGIWKSLAMPPRRNNATSVNNLAHQRKVFTCKSSMLRGEVERGHLQGGCSFCKLRHPCFHPDLMHPTHVAHRSPRQGSHS